MFMLNFPPRIIFGEGARGRLAPLLTSLGYQTALVLSDPHLVEQSWFARLMENLSLAGLFVTTYGEVPVEPCITDCERAVGLIKDRLNGRNADVLIAIGGGSVLDFGKAMRVLLHSPVSLAELVGREGALPPMLDMVAVPTTAGTGSEISAGAVLREGEGARKISISGNALRPTIALIDPELTWSCPPALTAESGVDALTHAIESWCARSGIRDEQDQIPDPINTGSNGLTRLLALEAVRMLTGALPAAIFDGTNRDARRDVAYGAMTAALAYGNSGLHAIHALGYALAARRHISHGRTLAVFLPAAIDVLQAHGVVNVDALSRAFAHSSADAGDRLAIRIARFLGGIGLKDTLSSLGLKTTDADDISADALSITRLSTAFPGDAERLYPEIVHRAYEGVRLA